jgi:hypothetical protein
MNQVKPSDYRIGNWVMYDNRYFQLHVIADEIPSLNTDEFGIGVVSWKSIQPIPLTPEILEKCGFKMIAEDFWRNYNLAVVLTKDGENLCFLNIEEISNAPKYLHQLQNIYLCLYGEELIFKPSTK